MKKASSIKSLKARIIELERERDYYLKALYSLIPRKAKRLTARQASQLKKDSVPFEHAIAEAERIVKG
jgi:hypothetical protein